MESFAKLPKRKLYTILIFSSIIIFSISMETMIKVKDNSLFLNWISNNESLIEENLKIEEYFNIYLVTNLSKMFFKVITPMALSLHSYFSYTRLRINRLFIFIWTILLLGGLAYNIIELNFYSIFYYINIVSYIILIINILSLGSLINKEEFYKG